MKPRVFVSSTYYDLRHVRERLEKFIENYGFESVLFESDKVTYEHNKPVDDSAYNEVTLCHIMILIVGGRYGTPATNLDQFEDQRKYENEYVSITRKEFETALKRNIPIFIFIDKNVYSEYQTYKENQDFFDNYETYKSPKSKTDIKIKFAHVDNINIFRFIDVIKSNPIKTFDRVEEIENYLQSQISGMFYLYLDNLQKQREVEKVLDTVSELNNISLRMNEMLTSVGKKVLGHENVEYEQVIEKQFEMIVDFFTGQIHTMLDAVQTSEGPLIDGQQQTRIAELIYEYILLPSIQLPEKNDRTASRKFMMEYDVAMVDTLNTILEKENIPVKFNKIKAVRLNSIFKNKVQIFITNDVDKNKLIESIIKSIWILLI